MCLGLVWLGLVEFGLVWLGLAWFTLRSRLLFGSVLPYSLRIRSYGHLLGTTTNSSRQNTNFCCLAFQHTHTHTHTNEQTAQQLICIFYLARFIAAIQPLPTTTTTASKARNLSFFCFLLLSFWHFWLKFCTLAFYVVLGRFVQLHIIATPPGQQRDAHFAGDSSDLWQQGRATRQPGNRATGQHCVYLTFCCRRNEGVF